MSAQFNINRQSGCILSETFMVTT